MMIEEVLKIATNTHHLKQPFSEESNLKSGRYSNWQGKGIFLFAIATIFTLGIATCFYIGTAYLKSREISQLRNRNAKEQKIDNIADNNSITNNTINATTDRTTAYERIDLTQKLADIKNKIIEQMEKIPYNDYSKKNTLLFVIQLRNNGLSSTKHCLLPSADTHPQSIETFRTNIQATHESFTSEIDTHLSGPLRIQWNVLIKHHTSEDKVLFCNANGNLIITPKLHVNSSDLEALEPIRAKKEFEKILYGMNYPLSTLESFALPDQPEPDSPEGLIL